MNASNFFVITGAPGTGKTALVEHLRARGYACVDEPAREVIAAERGKSGSGLPHEDAERFTQLLLARSIDKFERARETGEPIFFDRGVPDTIAYAAYYGLDLTPFEQAACAHRYNKKVFVLLPWEEIYTTDDERKMNFAESLEFQELILGAYKKLDYELIALPFDSIAARADFLLREIERAPFQQ